MEGHLGLKNLRERETRLAPWAAAAMWALTHARDQVLLAEGMLVAKQGLRLALAVGLLVPGT